MARTDLLQGTLDLLILRVLRGQPAHGWAVAQEIQLISHDALQINQGSLYPALHRLERRGLVRADWTKMTSGRRVRVYALTVDGQAALRQELADWRRFSAAIESVLVKGRA